MNGIGQIPAPGGEDREEDTFPQVGGIRLAGNLHGSGPIPGKPGRHLHAPVQDRAPFVENRGPADHAPIYEDLCIARFGEDHHRRGTAAPQEGKPHETHHRSDSTHRPPLSHTRY